MFCILWEANGPQLKDSGFFSGDPDMKNSGAIVWGLHLAVAPNPFLKERIVTGIRRWPKHKSRSHLEGSRRLPKLIALPDDSAGVPRRRTPRTDRGPATHRAGVAGIREGAR